MEEKTFDQFVDYMLASANIELAPNLRAEFGFQAFNRILESSLDQLGEELSEVEAEELTHYVSQHEGMQILEHLTKNFPRFREIFSEQADALGEELRERARGLAKLQ